MSTKTIDYKCNSETKRECFATGCPFAGGLLCIRYRSLPDLFTLTSNTKGAKHGTNEKDKQSKK